MNTKIKDFKIGDCFQMYDAIFKVTGDLKTWQHHNGITDNKDTFGRTCKFISLVNGSSTADELLKNYDWMQGIESVTYFKCNCPVS